MGSDEPERQQAMTAERLADIDEQAAENDFSQRAARDMYIEMKRLRAREAALVRVVQHVANGTTPTRHANYLIFGVLTGVELRQQARALLASASSERSDGDGG